MSRGTDVTDLKNRYREPEPGDFPGEMSFEVFKSQDLRYGENPNQPAMLAAYNRLAKEVKIDLLKSGKGGMSATNHLDLAHALYLSRFFPDSAALIMKHAIPPGIGSPPFLETSAAAEARGRSLDEIFRMAWDADGRSAFGSVVLLNRPMDLATAEAVLEKFVECVAAPGYEHGVMQRLEDGKSLRVLSYENAKAIPAFVGDDDSGIYNLIALPTGRMIVQKPYLTSIRSAEDLILDPMVRKDGKSYVVERDPTERELKDLLFAWYVNLGVRSNGIVLTKDGVTLAVGSGQTERVGAIENAIIKGYQKEMDRQGIEYDPLLGIQGALEHGLRPLEGAVCSSDAFFPFDDSVRLLARVGVSAVIQPGGSVKDYEVIKAVNESDMAMAFTGERSFAHF